MNSDFEQRVKDHYLQDRGEDYHLKKRKLSEELVPWVAKLREEKFRPYVAENADVFEFGAGAGWNLIQLRCGSKSAYDLSTLNQAKFAANKISFYSNEAQIPKAKFDVTICHHVLEHVPYPGITLSFLKETLKPDGKLVLVVPFEEVGSDVYTTSDREGHLYAWTPQSLGNLVDRAGFKVKEVKIKWRGYDRFVAELAKKLHIGELGFRILLKIAQAIRTDKEIILVATKS